MVKFIDVVTGNSLTTSNDFTIEQYRNYPERYVEEPEHETTTTQEAVEEEPEEKPAKKPGRPKKTT
jgi:hypothetical protein